MPELTAKQHYWSEHLKQADAFEGSVAQYAKAQNLPVKSLYRWRNYFNKNTAAKLTAEARPAFTQVVSAPPADSPLKLTLGNTQLEFARLPNPQWLVQLIAMSNPS